MPTQTGSIDFKSTKGFQSYASGQYATLTQVKGQFATCSTAAGTQAKAATIVPSDTGWDLYTGATITVRFTADNTHATPTLNVNSTGAKSIRDHTGAALTEEAYKWKAGDALAFTYDGAYWRMQDTLAQRVTTNKTAIEQTANNVLIKATQSDTTAAQGGQHLIESLINVAPSGVKIAADKVNIEGAAIFTSGRLSQTSLNNAYDAKGAAADAVNNLEIGGKNYVLNSSGTLVSGLGSADGSNKEYQALNVGQSYMDIPHGTQVTISFDLYMTVNTANPKLYVYNTNSKGPKSFSNSPTGTGSNPGVLLFFTAAAGTVIDERVSVTGYINDRTSPALTTNWLEFYSYYGTSNWFSISNLKLEKGNKATDWSPAPEDVAASAVKRTQRIWYRKSASGAPATPGTASSNWVVKADDGTNAWTKMHVSITETEKFIYTCEQYEMGDGTVGYTSVLLDNTITVIDGGTIITGSVTATQIAAGTITGEEIAANTIDGNNIKGSTITAEHLSSAFSLDLGKVEGLKERLESVEQGVSGVQTNTQWVHFDQSVGTVFGREGSANNVTITDEGINFNTDEGRAAWATGGVFHANEMEADTVDTRTVVMGDWAIVQSGSSFSIDYIGS